MEKKKSDSWMYRDMLELPLIIKRKEHFYFAALSEGRRRAKEKW